MNRSHDGVKRSKLDDDLAKSSEYPIDHCKKKTIYPSLLNIKDLSFTVPEVEPSVYHKGLREISLLQDYDGIISPESVSISPESNFLSILDFLAGRELDDTVLHVVVINYTHYIFELLTEKYPLVNIVIWGTKSVKESGRIRLGKGFPTRDESYSKNLLYILSAKIADDEMINYQKEVCDNLKPDAGSLLYICTDEVVRGKVVAQPLCNQCRLITDSKNDINENLHSKFMYYEAIICTTWPWTIGSNNLIMSFDECVTYDILISSFNLYLDEAIEEWKSISDRISRSTYRPRLPK